MRFSTALYITTLLALTFVAGALFAAANLFPAPYIARAYEGGRAPYAKMTSYDGIYASDIWSDARQSEDGVVAKESSLMQAGTTLHMSGGEAKAVLVSADCAILHGWRLPYSKAWNEHARVKQPQPDSHIYFRKAVACPNGDLLAVYECGFRRSRTVFPILKPDTVPI